MFSQYLDKAACIRLETALAALPLSRPGVRIGERWLLRCFLDDARPIGVIAVPVLGYEQANRVRAKVPYERPAYTDWLKPTLNLDPAGNEPAARRRGKHRRYLRHMPARGI